MVVLVKKEIFQYRFLNKFSRIKFAISASIRLGKLTVSGCSFVSGF